MLFSKFYSHIFYLTLRAMNWLSNNLITKPLIELMKVLSVSENRIKVVQKMHLIPSNNPDKLGDTVWAFRWMLWSLTWVILLAEVLIAILFKKEENLDLSFLFISACLASLLINILTLWRKDRYQKYFAEFKKKDITISTVLITVVFHTLPFVCFIILYDN